MEAGRCFRGTSDRFLREIALQFQPRSCLVPNAMVDTTSVFVCFY